MLLARCLLSIFCTIFYVIVTTLSGVGYASVNEQATPDIVVTNLFHDSCSLVEASDCSFTVGLLLISAKCHLQSIGPAGVEKSRRYSLAPLSTCRPSGISRCGRKNAKMQCSTAKRLQ